MDFESMISSVLSNFYVTGSMFERKDPDGPLEPVNDMMFAFPSSAVVDNHEKHEKGDVSFGQGCLYNTEMCTKQEPTRDPKNHDTSLYI